MPAESTVEAFNKSILRRLSWLSINKFTPCILLHSVIKLAINSGPLSILIYFGFSLRFNKWLSTHTTRLLFKE